MDKKVLVAQKRKYEVILASMTIGLPAVRFQTPQALIEWLEVYRDLVAVVNKLDKSLAKLEEE